MEINQKMFYEEDNAAEWSQEYDRLLADIEGTCRKCDGRGFFYKIHPEGHPDAGKPVTGVTGTDCECRKTFRLRYGLYLSDFGAKYPEYHLKTPLPKDLEVTERDLFNGIRETGCFNGGKKGLLIYGEYRTGKTSLAVSVARNLAKGFGYRVLFWDTTTLVERLRDRALVRKEPSDDLSWCQKIDVLVLDDFLSDGKEFEFSSKRLGMILNERYNALDKYTIITTNLPLEDLQKSVGERIWRRLEEYCTLVRV